MASITPPPGMCRSRASLVAALLAVMISACSGAAPAAGPTSAPGSAPAGTPAGGTPASPAPSGPPGSAIPGALSISTLLGGTPTPPATTWTRVSDAAAPFSYEVPSSWTMHAANPWQQGGATIGISLAAGPDLARLSTDFSVPGIVIGISADGGGLTPRQALAGDDFTSVCARADVQEASGPTGSAAYQLWRSCGGGTASLLVMVMAPSGSRALIGIVYQATTDADLGYLDHIVGSILPSGGGVPSAPAPASSGGAVSGQTYTISMQLCQNQHGQGVAEGLIRNDDTLTHTYRIVVAFFDPNGVFLNDTAVSKGDMPPGVTATWQAMVPSGLPAVTVSCRITGVEVVR